MKLLYPLCLVALAACCHGFNTNNRFLVRVDYAQLPTDAAIQNFSHMIEEQFKAYTIKSYKLGSLRLLLVKGEEANVRKIESRPEVVYVEKDELMTAFQTCEEQSAAGCWGLDRTDQREQLPYDDANEPSATYVWGEDLGTGVVAYVTDTGIDHSHPDFNERASHGYTAGGMSNDDDVNGHGTHCAGTIGSTSYGIAKDVELVAVKVLDDNGSGFMSWSVEGLEWILEQHNDRSTGGQTAKTVINMSLGGGGHRGVDDAAQACIDAGAVVVAAAGNSDADACGSSPARLPDAITVGATTVTDQTWRFTNYGSCLDLFAPGAGVLSTTPGGETASFSGTSMATPHVAGVVARYFSSQADTPTPAQVPLIFIIYTNYQIS